MNDSRYWKLYQRCNNLPGLFWGRTIAAAASTPSSNPGEIQHGTGKYFAYCALGGALCCGLTHTLVVPLDLVKTRVQVNPEKYRGLIKGIGITMHEDGGALGLTKGWLPTLIGYSCQGAAKFGFYEFFKVFYADFFSEQTAFKYRTLIYLAASSSAEFLADIVLSPMESVRVKMQTMPGFTNSFSEAVTTMAKDEGIGVFYRSLVPLWGRQIPYTMMKFASFERTLELLYKYVVPKPRAECTAAEQLVVTFTAGYLAGVLCAIVSHPADTMVSKMNRDKGSSAATIYKNIGFAGLWRGLETRIIMIGTLTALQWFIYDWFKVVTGLPRPPPPTDPSLKTGQK